MSHQRRKGVSAGSGCGKRVAFECLSFQWEVGSAALREHLWRALLEGSAASQMRLGAMCFVVLNESLITVEWRC